MKNELMNELSLLTKSQNPLFWGKNFDSSENLQERGCDIDLNG